MKLFNALMSVDVALPVLTVIANVVLSPFVNVIVLRLTEAVVKLKLADVNKLAVAVFNDEVLAPTAVNLVSTDAVYVARVEFFVSCDAVKALSEVISVAPPPQLPVLTVIAKVVLLPFVKVIVLRLTLAVIKNEPLSVSVTQLPD